MMGALDRRCFFTSTVGLTALGALRPLLSAATGRPKIAVSISMLPAERPLLERFRLAVDAGFSAVEMRTVEDPAAADRVREAVERSGLRIHSVVNAGRRFPLSSADREVVRQGVASMTASLRNAHLWGADAVVIAPAGAGPDTTYQDAWNRSQRVIRERILPLARDLDLVLAVEEVWDGFLLGPPEVARYVDAFSSPCVKACFDMGRIIFYTHPQDWIRAMGPRLVNVRARHIRLDRNGGGRDLGNMGEGSADWGEVRTALEEIAYDGWVTADIAGNDPAFLEDVATALRRHLP